MFGLDDWIAGLSEGGSVLVVVLVATLLGLRHATDPDHLAAVTALVASGREQAARSAARLGAWWGLGHAVTLLASASRSSSPSDTSQSARSRERRPRSRR